MGALVSKDKIQKRLDDTLAAAAENKEGKEGKEGEEVPAKGKKEDADKIEKLKVALRQKIEVSLTPGAVLLD